MNWKSLTAGCGTGYAIFALPELVSAAVTAAMLAQATASTAKANNLFFIFSLPLGPRHYAAASKACPPEPSSVNRQPTKSDGRRTSPEDERLELDSGPRGSSRGGVGGGVPPGVVGSTRGDRLDRTCPLLMRALSLSGRLPRALKLALSGCVARWPLWLRTAARHVRASEVVAAQARALSRIPGCVSSARQAKAGLRSLVPRGGAPGVDLVFTRGNGTGSSPRL